MTLTKHRGHGAKPLSRENKEILSSFVRRGPYLCLPAAFSVSDDFYLCPFLFHLLLSISIRLYSYYCARVSTVILLDSSDTLLAVDQPRLVSRMFNMNGGKQVVQNF